MTLRKSKEALYSATALFSHEAHLFLFYNAYIKSFVKLISYIH